MSRNQLTALAIVVALLPLWYSLALFAVDKLAQPSTAEPTASAPYKNNNMQGSVLVLNARGCEAKDPNGKPLQPPKKYEGGKFFIPKGSTFTPQCFSNEAGK